MLSHVPNLLTLLRIGAVPALILLLWERDYEFALAVFVLAGLSDGLDGYVAKRFGYVTRLGSILDPIADKMLIVSAYLSGYPVAVLETIRAVAGAPKGRSLSVKVNPFKIGFKAVETGGYPQDAGRIRDV